MRKKSLIEKKYLLIGLFILLIGGIGYGFALFEEQLDITGTATIPDTKWDIHFENPQVTAGSASGTAANAIIDSTDSTHASWEVTLNQPGDFYEFTLDVKNAGTFDAKLTDITADALSAAQDLYANYTITPIAIEGQNQQPTTQENDVLAAGKKYTLKFRIEFDPEVAAKNLPTTGATINLNYQLKYQQNS